MSWEKVLPFLQEIFQVCVVPLLGILTAYLVKFINAKSSELVAQTDNELAQKYLSMLTETIEACVIATNQTYVNSLKEKNAFTAEAQKEAFNKTLDAVKAVLSDEAKEYLTTAYGDLNTYLTNQIEAQVNQNRIDK